jgi:23S rRNA (guanosine2251-2'-O)-methyltransferase
MYTKTEPKNGGDEIIFGKNAVAEAISSGRTPDTIYVKSDAEGLKPVIAMAKAAGAVIKEVSLSKLNGLVSQCLNNEDGYRRSDTSNAAGISPKTDVRHSGIAAVFRQTAYSSVEEILAVSAEKGKPAFILMLAGIEDPHNLGALIRTAEAAGVDGVIIPERRSAGLSPAVYSASAGAVNHVKICRETNLTETVKKLKKNNVWIYGAEADGKPYRQVDFSGNVCLVIGSEGKGLGRLLRENCDFIVSVGMYGKVNSLNASVCGGILLYKILENR